MYPERSNNRERAKNDNYNHIIESSQMPKHNNEMSDFKVLPNVPHPTILLVGKRFSGKSTTGAALANMYKFDRWVAWCGTKETQEYWGNLFGSKATVYGIGSRGMCALSRIVQFQQQKILEYKLQDLPLPHKYSIGMIFDDVTANREFRKSKILEDLFANGRHYKAMILISCQYIKQLPPPVRSNADYIFILHNTKSTLKLLYAEYVESPETYDLFYQLVREVTERKDIDNNPMYMSLVFNNCTRGGSSDHSITSSFMIFRHESGFNISSIRLGSQEWRSYNQNTYKDLERISMERRLHQNARLNRIRRHKSQCEKDNRYDRSSGIGNNNHNIESDHEFEHDEDDIYCYTTDGKPYNSNVKIISKKGKELVIRLPREAKPPEIPAWTATKPSQNTHSKSLLLQSRDVCKSKSRSQRNSSRSSTQKRGNIANRSNRTTRSDSQLHAHPFSPYY